MDILLTLGNNSTQMKLCTFHKFVILMAAFCLAIMNAVEGQNDPAWDDSSASGWRKEFRLVEIPSSADGNMQKAFLYSSRSRLPKPLIVSLHTWSGDYSQADPLANEILARDWNYIHPDFRGRNGTPESTGSPLVISDISDAIKYAIDNTNADKEDVHIIGVSGGGYATLLAWMNITYPVRSFSAWAAISDLDAWYFESLGRKQRYAGDILKAVSADSVFNAEEARKRSPLHQSYPAKDREGSELFIYTGIHDGYQGSVPVTHSINMYNRMIRELKYPGTDIRKLKEAMLHDSSFVTYDETIRLLARRYEPSRAGDKALYGRRIHLDKAYKNINLKIFEGGHEQLPQALSLIPVKTTSSIKLNILTIGDSNGQIKDGWVDQLRKMLPGSYIHNNSQGGRTIGFDNLGRKELNALSNTGKYLDEAMKDAGKRKFDYIIVCLGTNDTKAEFSDRQDEVISNFGKLLGTIKKHSLYKKDHPKLIYVTPPPVRKENVEAKYIGCSERIESLLPFFTEIAGDSGFEVIDAFHPLKGILETYAVDGVHMSGPGQQIIAGMIVDTILKGNTK